MFSFPFKLVLQVGQKILINYQLRYLNETKKSFIFGLCQLKGKLISIDRVVNYQGQMLLINKIGYVSVCVGGRGGVIKNFRLRVYYKSICYHFFLMAIFRLKTPFEIVYFH